MERAKIVSNSIVAAAGTAIALTPSWVWGQQQQPGPNTGWYGPHMMDWGPWGFGMIFGPLFMILVLGVVVAVVVLLVRLLGGPWAPHDTPPGRTPLDILKERYARGEIDKEEFEERRRLLGD